MGALNTRRSLIPCFPELADLIAVHGIPCLDELKDLEKRINGHELEEVIPPADFDLRERRGLCKLLKRPPKKKPHKHDQWCWFIKAS